MRLFSQLSCISLFCCGLRLPSRLELSIQEVPHGRLMARVLLGGGV